MMLRCLPAILLLSLLTACGGHNPSPPGPATALHYVNPAPTGFRLEVEPATNDTPNVVLDLIGPAGTSLHGVAFFLTCDTTRALWSSPPNATGSALTLGAVPLFRVKPGAGTGDLQVGLFQTGAPPAVLGAAPIVSLGLSLNLAQGPRSGLPVALAPTLGRTSEYLDGNRTTQILNIGVGTLTTR